MVRYAAAVLSSLLLTLSVPPARAQEYSISSVRSLIGKAIPDASDLGIELAGDSVVLTGEVPSVADIETAEAILRGFTGKDAVIVNLLRVPGDHQVQLEVAFAEVSRSALRQIGLNFFGRGNNTAAGLVSPGTALEGVAPELTRAPRLDQLGPLSDAAVPLVERPVSGTFGAVFSSALGAFPFSATLSILSNRGYARVLAEPTLVALSGKSASFLAGGEFPIPLPQSLGNVAVEFKKFGIQLDFTPTVIGDDINLDVAMAVSDIDFSLGIRLAQVTVPGLSSRLAQSTIRLQDGQSFVIAGLLSDRVRSNVDAVPWLGDIPVIGALFRSSAYRREETELLVVVTAHLIRPTGERPSLPGENSYVDPSDIELFLGGRIESIDGEPRRKSGKKSKRSSASGRKPRFSAAPASAIGFKR